MEFDTHNFLIDSSVLESRIALVLHNETKYKGLHRTSSYSISQNVVLNELSTFNQGRECLMMHLPVPIFVFSVSYFLSLNISCLATTKVLIHSNDWKFSLSYQQNNCICSFASSSKESNKTFYSVPISSFVKLSGKLILQDVIKICVWGKRMLGPISVQ